MTWEALEKVLSGPAMSTITFMVGGVLGYLVSRFTLSKSEKNAFEQVQYQNGLDLKKSKEQGFQNFCNAMAKYRDADAPTLDDFLSFVLSGNTYFSTLRNVSDAILQSKVDRYTRDNTFLPDVVEAINKTIPLYYETVRAEAARLKAPYNGEFKRSNYESLYRVAEKYASKEIMPPAGIGHPSSTIALTGGQ